MSLAACTLEGLRDPNLESTHELSLGCAGSPERCALVKPKPGFEV